MSTFILFLPPAEDARAVLFELDDTGRVLARKTLAAGDTAAHAPGTTRTVLVVPGDGVRIDRLQLSAHSAVQARAAAQALLAGRLARPAALHVALDAQAATPGLRTVAAVEPAALRAWLAQAAAFGLRPDAAVPAPLLLPEPAIDGDAVVFDAGARWLVRGGGLAFAAPPALARQVLADRPHHPVSGGFDALAARALQPPLDLLQGDFAPASASARPAGRRLAWLAAALLASPLVVVAAQALRLEVAARALDARATATLEAALPHAGDSAAATPAERLRAARAPRAFASASGALFAAVSARPGTHLVELDYARDDRLRALLFHRDAADLEALRAALAADGWRLVEGGGAEVAGGVHTGLALEPMQ